MAAGTSPSPASKKFPRPRLRPGIVAARSRRPLAGAALLLAALLIVTGQSSAFAARPAQTPASGAHGDRIVRTFPAGALRSSDPGAALMRDLLAAGVQHAASPLGQGAELRDLDLVVQYAGAPADLDVLLAQEPLAGAAADITGGVGQTVAAGATIDGTMYSSGELTLDLSLVDPSSRPWFADLLARAYPVMAEVYGPPAQPIVVRVWVNAALPYAGLYAPAGNLLLLRELSQDTAVHELLHAFRDDLMSSVPVYEEGIVRAAEVEVLDRLGTTYWDSGHTYVYDRMYSAHNDDTLIGSDGTVIAGYGPMYLLRYQEAGMAWAKAELAQPGFLRAYNQRYVAAAAADPLVPGDGSLQRALFGTAGGTIEATEATIWAGLQHALAPTGGEGVQLHADVTDDSLTARVYHRGPDGTERPAPGSLTLTLTPAGASIPQAFTLSTSAAGLASLPLNSGSPTRLHVSIEAHTEYGSAARSFPAYGGMGSGLFGIVTGDAHAATGTVTATVPSPSGKPVRFTASLTGYAFDLPELADYRGSVDLCFAFDGESPAYAATVVKGRGATYALITSLKKVEAVSTRTPNRVRPRVTPPPPRRDPGGGAPARVQ